MSCRKKLSLKFLSNCSSTQSHSLLKNKIDLKIPVNTLSLHSEYNPGKTFHFNLNQVMSCFYPLTGQLM